MKRIIYYTLLTCAVILYTGCKKFVDIGTPKTKLLASTVFESDATATAAIISIYVSAINQTATPYIMALYPGLSADELKYYSSSVSQRQIYSNSLNPIDAQTLDIWKDAYSCIYQANMVIEGCTASSTLSANVKSQVMGEALFFRAFWNFYLVNEFGEVPLVITSDYNINSHLHNSTKEDIYKQIIADLKTAESSLNENYVNATSTTTTEERVRINKSAATSLLARTYLYNKQYIEAEESAGRVIDKKELYEIAALDEVFLKNSTDSILQLMKQLPTTQNTPEGTNFILTAKPTGAVGKSTTLSESLLQAFETGDLRKEKWVSKFTDTRVVPNVDYYYPFKYKISNSSEIKEYSMVLRLAEQYLIRAEARAQLGKLKEAIDDIDVIRQRAGIALINDTNPDINKEDLLFAILKERRVELFTEWGHRWLDIKRTGQVDAIMAVEAIVKGSVWDTRMQNYPIPQGEIDNNPNIVQNEGYK